MSPRRHSDAASSPAGGSCASGASPVSGGPSASGASPASGASSASGDSPATGGSPATHTRYSRVRAPSGAVTAIVIGVPAALGLIRGNLPGKTVLSALFRAPLQIPFIVIGVAFLQTWYLLGNAFGIRITGSFIALAVGHLFVATPYVIGSVGSVLSRFDPALEEAALSLGASRWRTFRRVTLPIVMPGIYAGALFAFMVSFGDVPSSLFLASPQYTTLPLEIFHSMEFDFDATVLAISTLIVFACLIILWLIQKSVGLDALLRSGGSG